MVDFDLSISGLKDASEAIDKLVDTIKKIGELFGLAAATGAQIVGFARTQATINHLTDLSATLTTLTASQSATFLPELHEYAASPSEQRCQAVQDGINHTLDLCKGLVHQIKGSSREIATKDFFETLLASLMERDRTLERMRDGPRPETPEALIVLREHTDKYAELLTRLQQANRSLTGYIESLRTGNKWPTN